MPVMSYLRMEIDPDQIEAHEEDLEERIQMARKTTGFLEVEVFQVYAEPNVSLVLGRWESHEAVLSFFMHEPPMEICLWVWSTLKLLPRTAYSSSSALPCRLGHHHGAKIASENSPLGSMVERARRGREKP
jgi:heme-degrading monooxygenase HmoA